MSLKTEDRENGAQRHRGNYKGTPGKHFCSENGGRLELMNTWKGSTVILFRRSWTNSIRG